MKNEDRFFTIGIETLNNKPTAPYEYGVVEVYKNKMVNFPHSHINPFPDEIKYNQLPNGLTKNQLQNAPKILEAIETLRSILTNQTVVSFTNFEMLALDSIAKNLNIENLSCTWVNGSQIIEKTWPKYFPLENDIGKLSNDFNLLFRPNEARDTARVTAILMILAIQKSKKSTGYLLNLKND